MQLNKMFGQRRNSLEPAILADNTVLHQRYRIVKPLNQGSVSQTYLAQDLYRPGTPFCVVKQLQRANIDPVLMPMLQEAFASEATILEALGEHPQIPRLLAYFEDRLQPYLVLEYVAGVPFHTELTGKSPLPETQVIQLLHEALNVLAWVHRQQVIHQDIKPNHFIRRKADQHLVLIDFGNARSVTGKPASSQVTGTVSTHRTLLMGTEGYIAPEQARGKPCFSSDLYSLGVLSIQALMGLSAQQLPFHLDSDELNWQTLTCSSAVVAFLQTLTAYHFKDRFPSAIAALETLRSEFHLEPIALEVGIGSEREASAHLDGMPAVQSSSSPAAMVTMPAVPSLLLTPPLPPANQPPLSFPLLGQRPPSSVPIGAATLLSDRRDRPTESTKHHHRWALNGSLLGLATASAFALVIANLPDPGTNSPGNAGKNASVKNTSTKTDASSSQNAATRTTSTSMEGGTTRQIATPPTLRTMPSGGVAQAAAIPVVKRDLPPQTAAVPQRNTTAVPQPTTPIPAKPSAPEKMPENLSPAQKVMTVTQQLTEQNLAILNHTAPMLDLTSQATAGKPSPVQQTTAPSGSVLSDSGMTQVQTRLVSRQGDTIALADSTAALAQTDRGITAQVMTQVHVAQASDLPPQSNSDPLLPPALESPPIPITQAPRPSIAATPPSHPLPVQLVSGESEALATGEPVGIEQVTETTPLETVAPERASLEPESAQPAPVMSADERYLIAISQRHQIKVWDSSTGELHYTLGGQSDPFQAVAVDPDGRTLIGITTNNTQYAWDLETGTPVPLAAPTGNAIAPSAEHAYF